MRRRHGAYNTNHLHVEANVQWMYLRMCRPRFMHTRIRRGLASHVVMRRFGNLNQFAAGAYIGKRTLSQAGGILVLTLASRIPEYTFSMEPVRPTA